MKKYPLNEGNRNNAVFTAIFVFSSRSSMSYPLVWVGATVRRFNCYTRLPNNKRERQVLIKYEVSTRKDRIEMSCQNRVELGGHVRRGAYV